MMAIALHAGDAQGCRHGEILGQRDRTEVGEIFAAEDCRQTGAAPLGEQAGVGDALENAFAILVAGAEVPGGRIGQRSDRFGPNLRGSGTEPPVDGLDVVLAAAGVLFKGLVEETTDQVAVMAIGVLF